MAHLAYRYLLMREAMLFDRRQRRNLMRMARYNNKAFSMTDEEFRANYRVSKELFEELVNILVPFMPVPKRRSDISSKYKILVALSFFATGSYQRLVGGTHGTLMSQQSVSRALRDVNDALNNRELLNKFIRFPQTRQERDEIKRKFYEKFGIPAVIGCIDGTHVAIKKPVQNEERFFNRKHYHSRNVLIICDSDLNILSVDPSFGGATHDSFVWNQHPVKQHLQNLINSGEAVTLLGDSGYAQREFMMTPIIGADEGSPEDYYNKLHCTARNTVERSIGVLKNRWRCLLKHRVLHYHPNAAAKIINSCCVLHNLCNRARLGLNETSLDETRETEESQSFNRTEGSSSMLELRRGIEARATLVQQLWSSRRTNI